MVARTAVSIGLLWSSAGASYVNNYDTSDNAYGVKLPSGDVRESSFAFLVSEYGLPTTSTGSCCQTMVADAMRAKKAALERLVEQLQRDNDRLQASLQLAYERAEAAKGEWERGCSSDSPSRLLEGPGAGRRSNTLRRPFRTLQRKRPLISKCTSFLINSLPVLIY